MKLKIWSEEILVDIVGTPEIFPKYTAQIMNLANQNAQGTRPKVVGQMSDLIQEFPGKTLDEWKARYQTQVPNGIEDAANKIYDMLQKLKEAIVLVDRDLIKRWVKDLVLTKTFVGLRYQESILIRVAAAKGTSYRLSNPAEEARGIDGYVGSTPVSIKPDTYKAQGALPETIEATIIYYNKVDDGIEVNFEF